LLAVRAVGDVAGVAALAQRAVGGVVRREPVVAAQPAQQPRAFALRVVTQFQTGRGRPLLDRGHAPSAGQLDAELVHAPALAVLVALLLLKFALGKLNQN
jgi:hypothetical protein